MSQRDGAFVFILESPSGKDLLDGRTEGRTLSEALSLAGTDSCYSMVTNRELFYEALRSRMIAAIERFPTKSPILHFSMHGSPDGVALTNGDFVTWDEMRSALSGLNSIMTRGLLICMSSCFGGAGCRMAMHEEDAQPFWALIGNSGSPTWADAAVAYVTFYHQLFKGSTVENAVAAMQVASGDNNFAYFYGGVVKQSWVEYVATRRTQPDMS